MPTPCNSTHYKFQFVSISTGSSSVLVLIYNQMDILLSMGGDVVSGSRLLLVSWDAHPAKLILIVSMESGILFSLLASQFCLYSLYLYPLNSRFR